MNLLQTENSVEINKFEKFLVDGQHDLDFYLLSNLV